MRAARISANDGPGVPLSPFVPFVPGFPCGPCGPGTVDAAPCNPCGPCAPGRPLMPLMPAVPFVPLVPGAPGAPACAIITHGDVPGIADPAATGPVATYVDAPLAATVPPVPIVCELPAPAADSEYALSPLMLHVP